MKKIKGLVLTLILLFEASGILLAQDIKIDAHQRAEEARQLTEDTEIPKKKDFETAFHKLEEAMKLDPTYYETYIVFAKTLRSYSIIYLDPAKKEELKLYKSYQERAKSLVQTAIPIAPKRPEAYHVYLLLLEDYETDVHRQGSILTTEDKNEMGKVKKKLYELDPDHPDVMEWRGYDLINEGRIKQGIILVKKGMRGEETAIWSQKEKLAEVLKKNGHAKEAEEIIAEVQKEKKFFEGINEIRYGNVDKGVKLVNESADHNLAKLPEYQRKQLANELERKQKYKEAADVYELIDPAKYREEINKLKKAAKTKANQK